MLQPDPRLLRPILRLRAAILLLLLVTYTGLWGLWRLPPESPQFWQFMGMAGVVGTQCLLSLVLYLLLNRKNSGLLVHLSLLIDTVATTGLILCTGYAGSIVPLFYLLILLAAGLLYGLSTGIYYFLCISLANVAALVLDRLFPLFHHVRWHDNWAFVIMGTALPLVAFPLLLVFRLTQRGRYFEALYENISDGLFILDDEGRIVEANGRAALMAARNRNELVRMSLDQLVAPDDLSVTTVRQQLLRCLAGESVSFEMMLDRPDGDALPVEVSAQLVSGLSPGRIQAFARDISARRFMEAEIRRQNEELRRINQELQVGRDVALNASRLKSQFLANMSHELRTPLNSIIGYTQFVLEDRANPLSDDQREDLGRVLRAARQLLELINGVLDLARIESGRESVTISRCPLGDLIDSVVDAVTPMAKGKGVRLACEVAPEIPDLETDEKKLRQVLLNLLANAVKFTERGSVEVECRLVNGLVQITVRDSGVGIPSEHLDEIFNEFHQVDPSIHKQYGGSGLGLAIVRRLVELLKGAIEVESTLGKGSTFTVTIPVSLAQFEDSADGVDVSRAEDESEPAVADGMKAHE